MLIVATVYVYEKIKLIHTTKLRKKRVNTMININCLILFNYIDV